MANGLPHAVCIPAAAQSHIKAMMKLSKLLYHKGFYITFVNNEYNHNRFIKSRGPNSMDGLPNFRFETIPDGLPPSDADTTQDVNAVTRAVRNNMAVPFRKLIEKLNGDTMSKIPPVTCIISDGFMPFTVKVGKELGILVAMSFSISACALMGYKQYSILKAEGFTPLKDESYLTNGYLDTVVDIPGMTDIRLRDLPSFVRTTDPNDLLFDFCSESAEEAFKSSAIIIHTFEALEREVINSLKYMFPHIYAIGPLELLLKQMPEDSSASMGYNLWKEDTECIQWLDDKENNSVVYINFGSITVMTSQQLHEFAWGLANSKHPFLLIIRPDLVTSDYTYLPPEFIEETRDRCMITSWCPQEEILNHPSIGVFLTHSGWGSTIESLSAGKPMICWPFFSDQQMNCRFTCNEWGVGNEIDSNAKRDQVEKLVREMMENQEGKKMKNKAIEWKRLAEEAVTLTGSSLLNLNELVNKLLGSNKEK